MCGDVFFNGTTSESGDKTMNRRTGNLTNYHSHCLYCDGRANMEDFVRFALSEGSRHMDFLHMLLFRFLLPGRWSGI